MYEDGDEWPTLCVLLKHPLMQKQVVFHGTFNKLHKEIVGRGPSSLTFTFWQISLGRRRQGKQEPKHFIQEFL